MAASWPFQAGIDGARDSAGSISATVDEVVDVAMVMFGNEANDPIRFELLEFTGRDGAAFNPGLAGIQAVGFTVAEVDPQRITTTGGVITDIRPD